MFLNFLSVFFSLTELIKQILLYSHYGAEYSIWYFPFQLCSLPIYLLPLYAKTKNTVLETFLIDFSLLGGIFVFFDQSGMHYDMPVLTVHSYLWHIMMIVTGVYLTLHTERKMSFRDYLPAAGLLLFFAGTATVLNLTLIGIGGINMFYISPRYHMDQIVFCDIASRIGDGAARIIYLVCILLGGGLIHMLCGGVRSIWHCRHDAAVRKESGEER